MGKKMRSTFFRSKTFVCFFLISRISRGHFFVRGFLSRHAGHSKRIYDRNLLNLLGRTRLKYKSNRFSKVSLS